jgi:alpha-glucan,water dikinase
MWKRIMTAPNRIALERGALLLTDASLDNLAREIVEREAGPHGWTLMHRFNLCYDLLDRVSPGDGAGLSLLFVWLRFSAIRQLDWQRNYNTKPRELAHAQDRLTLKLADRYARAPGDRPWLRLLMSTVGRGGEGQRVRDEVLTIMHRHHIKEVSGHFMEEWHQKLHNNTTPDDVVLCEAFLAFQRTNGDLAVFYRTLESGGVTRARLQGYERPIRSDPDFLPGLKDVLIGDFEEFLHILRKLHSGTDLGAAIEGAQGLLDTELGGLVEWIRRHGHDQATPLAALVARITDARRIVAARLGSLQQAGPVRALVYLDLALEELVRLSIERQVHQPPGVDEMATLVTLEFENVCLSVDDEEVQACRREWERVRSTSRRDPLWGLRADAVLERTARAVAALLDRHQQVLQPKAELLGHGFHADPWTIASFSEEVMRGRPIVALPVLARLLRQAVRGEASLPPWQLVSRGRGIGELRSVESLASIQRTRFERPTIVVAAGVGGQEEIPIGVTAVVTPQDVDVLSHVAIRARNAGVLLATCHDPDQIARLKAHDGRQVTLTIGASGDVKMKEGVTGAAGVARVMAGPPARQPRWGAEARATGRVIRPAGFSGYAVTQDRFEASKVGSKALNLVRLAGKLPSWIHLPRSVAVPFGAMEQALADPQNAEPASRYRDTLDRLEQTPVDEAEHRRRLLEDLRETVMALAVPDGLMASLGAAMDESGLTRPPSDQAWRCIKSVWASKWNERAFLSREANRIAHGDLAMSVLIQRVVEADYAFVIHTASPFTGAPDEMYAELVLGLGETLAGNYPGRALGFTWSKPAARAQVRSLPSKSTGLVGGGLIFRSDSNAEDLAGYAGAGLYDSVMLTPPRELPLDYAGERLVWDDQFRAGVLGKVAEIGIAVEQASGAAQDIEGACAKGEWYVLQSRPQVGPDDA